MEAKHVYSMFYVHLHEGVCGPYYSSVALFNCSLQLQYLSEGTYSLALCSIVSLQISYFVLT